MEFEEFSFNNTVGGNGCNHNKTEVNVLTKWKNAIT